MDEINIENEFIKLISELTDDKFYVPTVMHSSGFNQVEIYEIGSDKDFKMYNVSEENEADIELNFNELIKKYPKFTLVLDLAFHDKFETWENYKLSLEGKKRINLINL